MYVIEQTYIPTGEKGYMDVCGVFCERWEGVDVLPVTNELAYKLKQYFELMGIAGGGTDYGYAVVDEGDVCTQ